MKCLALAFLLVSFASAQNQELSNAPPADSCDDAWINAVIPDRPTPEWIDHVHKCWTLPDTPQPQPVDKAPTFFQVGRWDADKPLRTNAQKECVLLGTASTPIWSHCRKHCPHTSQSHGSKRRRTVCRHAGTCRYLFLC
jgi:hypothetical protein